MKNKGFTLIELLVVVLIIGILAAIAVPEYQKSVLNSRLSQYLVYMDALRKGADVYYLTHNTTPYDTRDIDVSIYSEAVEFGPSKIVTKDSKSTAVFFKDGIECAFSRDGVGCLGKDYFIFSLHPWAAAQYQYKKGFICYGYKNSKAEAVCKSRSNGVVIDYNSLVQSNGYRIKE